MHVTNISCQIMANKRATYKVLSVSDEGDCAVGQYGEGYIFKAAEQNRHRKGGLTPSTPRHY